MSVLFDLHPGEARVRRLGDADSRFADLARLIGPLSVPAQADAFAFLVRSLIGQQLSVKAAATITGRVLQHCGELTPGVVLAVPEENLRAAGVSKPKIAYVKGLAGLTERQELDFARFSGMDDAEAVAALTTVKGIGRWTAEMFLIFVLGRENVLSLGDAGLRRAAAWLYKDAPGGEDAALDRLGRTWEPYRSIASLYLWEAINRGHVGAGPFGQSPDAAARSRGGGGEGRA
ncbi:DNA-3-methyladenine glycosylase family protein [Paenibacillus humicola]|uniref:DNA-3-methyladenine glycosylase family protein n=1 Tax=Paenibacillus humicola TaxID=3110540 RepID=UPI00237B68CE|nr:DNA-3-methyladenine glycosylase 2 family protein [Paenibacillus humicola]